MHVSQVLTQLRFPDVSFYHDFLPQHLNPGTSLRLLLIGRFSAKPDSIQILQVFLKQLLNPCSCFLLLCSIKCRFCRLLLLLSAGYRAPLQFTVLLLHSLLMRVNNLLAKTGNKRQKCFFFLLQNILCSFFLQDSKSSNASFCPLLSSHTSHGDKKCIKAAGARCHIRSCSRPGIPCLLIFWKL